MEQKKQLVIGIDLGSADSYVGYITKGTVDIVQNEVSQRKTPSLVGFTERQRLLGDAALSQIKSNAKNTCRNFKHLLGQGSSSEAIGTERVWSTCTLAEGPEGFAGCSVNYKGEPHVFSMQAITAMFLNKLRAITQAWAVGEVADVVIGVPPFFSDVHRTALLDAARIAKINVLRLMNEHTATALEYGYFRSAEFDAEQPFTVAFCSMGHVVFSVAIVQYVHGKLTVLCERSAKVGGRDMDACLMRVFAEQFKKKTGCDVFSSKKAMLKLEDAVSKTKKILSANSEASITCECLMEDEDFASHIDRSDFLDMCKPMMKQVTDVLRAARENCGLQEAGIDAVEMCGGASRVPWVKELCSKAFGGKDLSTTMNADECVARGCTLQAAILSPLYKARPFTVEDTNPHPISLGWASASSDGPRENTMVLFPRGSPVHVLKVLTFFRQESFNLRAFYSDEAELIPGAPRDIATYTVEVPEGSVPRKVKVKVALTIHGTFKFEGAHVVEEEATPNGATVHPAVENGTVVAKNVEAQAASDRPAPTSPNGSLTQTIPQGSNAQTASQDVQTTSDGNIACAVLHESLARTVVHEGAHEMSASPKPTGGSEANSDGVGAWGAEDGEELAPGNKRPAPRASEDDGDARGRPTKAPRRAQTSELVVVTRGAVFLGSATLAQQMEAEEAMVREGMEIEEADARKNDLEAYIFNMRSNIGEGTKYAPYIRPEDCEKLRGRLQEAEDWLYEHTDEAKQVFVDKLAELKTLGGPAEERFQDDRKRPELIARLEEAMRNCMAFLQQPGFDHLHGSSAPFRDLEEAAARASRWLSDLRPKQAEMAKYEDPILRCEHLESRTAELERLLDEVRRHEPSNGGAVDAPPLSPLLEVS